MNHTLEEIVDELTEITVAHLDTLSADEREKRIQAFQNRVESSRVGREGHVTEV